VTVTELHESRRTGTTSAELIYIVTGTASDTDAKDALEAEAPATWDDLTRTEVEVEPVRIDTGDADSCIWRGTARYGQSPPTESSTYSFDTTGGNQHVTNSLATPGKYKVSADPNDPPDFKGAVGVTENGVGGVDIVVPVFQFAETHYKPSAFVTVAYVQTLRDLTGTVNDDAFKGFAAGEVLFLGATGNKRGGGDWAITYKFGVSPNRTNIEVGDITVASKKGWEYLWVFYRPKLDADAKIVVQRPVAAYVEKLYEEKDLSDLGIGT
jgi:hypothetical protein